MSATKIPEFNYEISPEFITDSAHVRPGERRWIWLADHETTAELGLDLDDWEVEAVVAGQQAVALRRIR